MQKRKIGILLQISMLLVTVLSPLAVADSFVPEDPMILTGTIINEDTNEWAPDGTIITAKESGTDRDLGTTKVSSDGIYGDKAYNKLLVNKCEKFEIYITIDGNEVKVQDTFTWKSGEFSDNPDNFDIGYSKDTSTGDSSTDDSSSGNSRSNYKAAVTANAETALAGGEGIEVPPTSTIAGTSSEAGTSTIEGTSLEAGSAQSTEDNKPSSSLSIIALFAILALVAFVVYKKLR